MPTPVYVCRKCKAHEALVERLEGDDEVAVTMVRCQDICKGAVAGLEVDGTITWFRSIKSGKQRKSLTKLARRGGAGPVPNRLVDHIAAKRTGRPPRPDKAPKRPEPHT